MVKDEIKYQKMNYSASEQSRDNVRYPGEMNDSSLCINTQKFFKKKNNKKTKL